MSALARLLATWFYLGYVPRGPGTAGSLGALAAAYLLTRIGVSTPAFAVLALALLGPAIWSAGWMARETGRKDPQIVVVDEVVGQWITLAAAGPDWVSWVWAFVAFRLFDILKPPPVRTLERVPGGAGIVLDDVMAGIYGGLVLYAAGWFNLR